MNNILITGGRGFIGTNLINLWKRIRPGYLLVETDGDTYADKFLYTYKNDYFENHEIPNFIIDLSKPDSQESLMSIVETFNIDTIVHCASESHVDNSISGPMTFFSSNVIGTANVLEVVRKKNLRFHLMSTDEVLGITKPEDCVTEDSLLRPSSPYSSSKASQELMVQSYIKTYGIKATISRCCNNFGPWQQSEKFIPTVVRSLENNLKIPVYGNGQQCRQWIFVDDHNRAILDILENGTIGKTYHISSNRFGYMKNLDIVGIFAKEYGKSIDDVIEHVTDRPGHDTSYFISNYETLDYSEPYIKEKLIYTLNWYRKQPI